MIHDDVTRASKVAYCCDVTNCSRSRTNHVGVRIHVVVRTVVHALEYHCRLRYFVDAKISVDLVELATCVEPICVRSWLLTPIVRLSIDRIDRLDIPMINTFTPPTTETS